MRIPVIRAVIERRILANYRIEPEVAQSVLTPPFRPKLHRGFAIGGICLIRLARVRPAFLPFGPGLSSENGAHRFAVEWDAEGGTRSGVFIPRRDTSSLLSAAVGGRLFPGVHHRASFVTQDTAGELDVRFESRDGRTRVRVAGAETDTFPEGSIFGTLSSASAFFEDGSLGYSATAEAGRYDGLELRVRKWEVRPLAVTEVESSYFEDADLFPPGSAEFDCALLMRDVEHEWHGRGDLEAG